MPLPNPSMSFTPFDPLPASDLNDIVENIEALQDGSSGMTGAVGMAVQNVGASSSAVATGTTQIPLMTRFPRTPRAMSICPWLSRQKQQLIFWL